MVDNWETHWHYCPLHGFEEFGYSKHNKIFSQNFRDKILKTAWGAPVGALGTSHYFSYFLRGPWQKRRHLPPYLYFFKKLNAKIDYTSCTLNRTGVWSELKNILKIF